MYLQIIQAVLKVFSKALLYHMIHFRTKDTFRRECHILQIKNKLVSAIVGKLCNGNTVSRLVLTYLSISV